VTRSHRGNERDKKSWKERERNSDEDKVFGAKYKLNTQKQPNKIRKKSASQREIFKNKLTNKRRHKKI